MDPGVQDGVELAEALDDDRALLGDDFDADVGRAGRDGEVPERGVVGSRDGRGGAEHRIVLGESQGGGVPAWDRGGRACESRQGQTVRRVIFSEDAVKIARR